RVRITKDASVCAVLSGIFLDEIQNNSLSGADATWSHVGAHGNVPKNNTSKTLSNPQLKQAAFAAYIKNNPPANLAAAKARVHHLLDNGEVGLARLAVPAWLHRAAAQSPAAGISTYKDAVKLFALRDNDYSSDL